MSKSDILLYKRKYVYREGSESIITYSMRWEPVTKYTWGPK